MYCDRNFACFRRKYTTRPAMRAMQKRVIGTTTDTSFLLPPLLVLCSPLLLVVVACGPSVGTVSISTCVQDARSSTRCIMLVGRHDQSVFEEGRSTCRDSVPLPMCRCAAHTTPTSQHACICMSKGIHGMDIWASSTPHSNIYTGCPPPHAQLTTRSISTHMNAYIHTPKTQHQAVN